MSRFTAIARVLLDEVLEWAREEDQPIKLRLQAGEGGAGKTRLAIEACRRLGAGWASGFLRGREDLETRFGKLVEEGGDLFMVIDYAETRSSDVIALVRGALKAHSRGKVRLLLLARDGGDWWDGLADGAKDDAAVAAILRRPSTKTGPYRMSEERIEPAARPYVFREALEAFAEAKAEDVSPFEPPDLSADHFGQVLFIHLAALAALRGTTAIGDRELLDMALGHERAYWRYLFAEVRLEDEVWLPAFEQTVALLTLVGGSDSAREAKDLIARTPRLHGASPILKGLFFDLLRRLYRAGGGIGGLQPDLLGERLVADALARDDELIDVALEKSSMPEEARRGLTVLTRLARRDSAEERWLASALERHLPERVREAVEVALETGPPMPGMIAQTLRAAERGTQRRLVRGIRPKLPDETTNLKRLAILVAEQLVSIVQKEKGSRRGWKAARQLRDAYQHLAQRHEAAGLFKEAVEARRLALESAETMARSGSPADSAAAAAARGNFALALSRVGAFAQALEHATKAEEAFEVLAERRPGAYRPDWAASLVHLASELRNLGRFDEALTTAEQAARILSEMAALPRCGLMPIAASGLHR